MIHLTVCQKSICLIQYTEITIKPLVYITITVIKKMFVHSMDKSGAICFSFKGLSNPLTVSQHTVLDSAHPDHHKPIVDNHPCA